MSNFSVGVCASQSVGRRKRDADPVSHRIEAATIRAKRQAADTSTQIALRSYGAVLR
jgi:hypothetical protein